jgi:putative inorganic carbon (HCO3(-)) transporter
MTATRALDKFLKLTLPPSPFNSRFYQPILVAWVIILGLAIAWLPIKVTILLLGGSIFLVLLLRQPILSLYLLIPTIPFSPLVAISLGGFKVGLMEVILASGLVAWLLQLSTRHNYQNPSSAPLPLYPSAPLLWPFLLFIGSVALSWLNTLSIGASLVETIKWVEMLLLYLLVTALLPARQVKWVVVTLLLTGMAQAALGLYQFIFKVGPEGFLLFGGRFLRAYGTFAQPNPYAGYLGLILPLAFALVVWGVVKFVRARVFDNALLARSQNKFTGQIAKILILVLSSLSLGLLLAALLASQSRAAWLGFAVAAVVTLIALNRKPGITLATLVFVGAIVLLTSTLDLISVTQMDRASLEGTDETATAYSAVIQRLADAVAATTITDISTLEVNDANFAIIERLAHWQAGREMWRDHPWLGVGFGNYAVVYPAYAVGRWFDPLGHAHNYLLNIGAETGLVGIMGYLIFWILTFRVTWLVVQRNHGFDRAIAAGGLGILVHLHIHNLFDNLYVQGMYLHVAIILALISILYAKGKNSSNARNHHQFPSISSQRI